ncbi:FMR1-interacting protein NUFIP2 [Narcine bancroftii]|uniref:FMR1-interacting protein NUFIP2 n=1 Tax=Narcine bancroftii TaxID=1343680 RepID=UPI0038318404
MTDSFPFWRFDLLVIFTAALRSKLDCGQSVTSGLMTECRTSGVFSINPRCADLAFRSFLCERPLREGREALQNGEINPKKKSREEMQQQPKTHLKVLRKQDLGRPQSPGERVESAAGSGALAAARGGGLRGQLLNQPLGGGWVRKARGAGAVSGAAPPPPSAWPVSPPRSMDEKCSREQPSAPAPLANGDAQQQRQQRGGGGDLITKASDASSDGQKAKKKKKAGFEELNGDAGSEDELESTASPETEELNLISSSTINGRKQFLDTNYNPRHTTKTIVHNRVVNKTKNYNQKNSMDKKNDKVFENKSRDSRSIEKKEALSFLNGVISSNSAYITNGFSIKNSADNDGSGSESGYTTPKKRKGRRNSDKGVENLNLFQDKVMQHEGNPQTPKLDLDITKIELPEQKASRLENAKPSGRYEVSTVNVAGARGKVGAAETQRKNSDGKPSGGKKYEEKPKAKAASVTSKEDSWTLFKPPPVFPVDNSSAKIVPKISYASKVKENLNKSSSNQSLAVDTQTQASGRLSQVPMSAVKTVTSTSFSNGLASVVTDGHIGVSGVQTVTAANTVVPASSGSETSVSPDSTDPAAMEQRKQGLFVYPSNMQSVLPGTTQVELPSQTTQQNLGDIFQNQWGLSFINEPSAGPELATVKSVDNPLDLTFQAECAATLVSQGAELVSSGSEIPVFPKAYELDKRTSPQVLSNVMKTAIVSANVFAESPTRSVEPHVSELQKMAATSQSAIGFALKDFGNETPQQASSTNALVPSAKEHPRYHRGFDRKDGFGSFDLKSAVMYHTKEMDSIWNLHKQDPSRVVTYDESMDRPGQ